MSCTACGPERAAPGWQMVWLHCYDHFLLARSSARMVNGIIILLASLRHSPRVTWPMMSSCTAAGWHCSVTLLSHHLRESLTVSRCSLDLCTPKRASSLVSLTTNAQSSCAVKIPFQIQLQEVSRTDDCILSIFVT